MGSGGAAQVEDGRGETRPRAQGKREVSSELGSLAGLVGNRLLQRARDKALEELIPSPPPPSQPQPGHCAPPTHTRAGAHTLARTHTHTHTQAGQKQSAKSFIKAELELYRSRQ